MQLGKQLHRLAIAERGKRAAREPSREALAFHVPAVVVELDLEPIGLDARFLARRFARRTERIAEPKPGALPQQREAEHRERDGERERAAQDEEPRGGERGDAAHLAESDGETARVGDSELASGQQKQDEERATEEKIDHGSAC